MQRRSWIGAVLIALTLVTAACAAGVTGRGAHELAGSVGWDSFHASYDGGGAVTTSTLLVSPTYGYFFVDNLQIQTRLTVAYTSAAGQIGGYSVSGSSTVWAPMVGVVAHAPVSNTYVPYLGLGVGWSWYSDSEGTDAAGTSIFPIVVGGAKVFVTDSTALDLGLFYMHQANAGHSEGVDASDWGLTAGLSLFLGSKVAPAESSRRDDGMYPGGWWD